MRSISIMEIEGEGVGRTVDAETLGACSVTGEGRSCSVGARIKLIWPPKPANGVRPQQKYCDGLHYYIETYSALRLLNAGARTSNGSRSPVGLTICEHMVRVVE